MRAILRAAAAAAILLPVLAGHPAWAAEPRQVITTEGADYFGGDYDVRKNVDLNACKAACVGDKQCKAFTFNTAAGWCFMKKDVGELRSVGGAISGRITVGKEQVVNVEATRLAELAFLTQSYVDEARRFVGRLKDVDAQGKSLSDLVSAADASLKTAQPASAAESYLAALHLDGSRYDLWMNYTRTALASSSDNYQVMEKLRDDRVSGAVNAYLHAVTNEERATALDLMAQALSGRSSWRPAIRAWRAALKLAPTPELQAAYDKAMDEHGFRITDHTVDADSATPRVCVTFSDTLATTRGDLSDYVTVQGGTNLSVEASGQQICVDGVEHGNRYRISARPGLPSADGEVLAKQVDLDVYVRDRAPTARFSGNAYVLPAGGDATIPVISVNASKITANLFRIGDREIATALSGGNFLSDLSEWQTDEIKDKTGEAVWTGTVDIVPTLNHEVTTAIPVGAMNAHLGPGIYILTAKAGNETDNYDSQATQWFIVTDLGLTTLSGNDGLHVMVRSLGTAAPVAGTKLRLIAVNNEILGEAPTDANGYALFAAGLMRGTGGMAPGLLVAEGAAGDFSFIDMSRSPMDLTDRGVDGRSPPGPLDVFLTTERGIYRVGETVYATALVRDSRANAVSNVPLTAIVKRPDGKEHSRSQVADEGQGGSVTQVAIPGNGMRGTWRIGIYADPKGEPLAETSFMVEDFQAERLTFDLAADTPAIDPENPPALTIEAHFLYGAPGANLSVEGETNLKPVRTLSAYPDYVFGMAREKFEAEAQPFSDISTDEEGRATVPITLPELTQVSQPLQATINVRVLDTSGRPVERSIAVPVAGGNGRLGLRPMSTEVAENSSAAYEVIAVGAGGERVASPGAAWSLYKVESNYQWYRTDGRWDYEIIRTRQRVDGGTVDIPADAPAKIEHPVNWGTYELEVAAADGSVMPASDEFEAGWYVEPQATQTPEMLKLSLDKPRYRIGDIAKVHLETRFPGVAQVMVVDDRLIDTKAIEVSGTSADVEIPVTREWGPGAYVTAFLYRPMDIDAKRMPARAVGLSWATVDPADRLLAVSLATADEMRPRQAMAVDVSIDNAKPGDEAYVTLAAVDLGILNLTRYETPAPESYYFGQRQLGMSIRDVYNQLIDRIQGTRGVVHTGGDAPLAQFDGPPPPETLVAVHSGVVRIGPDGKAHIELPIPDFNGTVRLMAMAWSKEGVGHAQKDVLVRDPIVIATTLPRFLAPGDTSRLGIDLTAIEAPAGPVSLAVSSEGEAVAIDAASSARTLELKAGARQTLLVPIRGMKVGDGAITVSLTLQNGEVLEKNLTLGVRNNEPPIANTSFITLAPGGSVSVGADALADFVPGTATIDVSATAAGRMNVPAILRQLDRYPYGCTEQLASRAVGLVYLNQVAVAAGLGSDPDIRKRVNTAIMGVLANQAASGSFGLWGPGEEDLWLDSYVTDFLTRAKDAGYDVPPGAFDLAVDNLKNKLAYANDFDTGGQDIAYALYVLAKNGRASIGDLRYYLENKLAAFSTPLAKAQIGAALALYGDKGRADTAFRASLTDLRDTKDERGYRIDYGSPLRDGAAVLTLASETHSSIDIDALATKVELDRERKPYTSTQEDSWTLLAAHALMTANAELRLAVDGEAVKGPLVRRFDAGAVGAAPIQVANRGEKPAEVAVTVSGVPANHEPASGNYYKIERWYYTLEGEQVEPSQVKQGTRLVAVVGVTTTEPLGAHLVIDDPLPAGFEIDNPHVLGSGDVSSLDWMDLAATAAHTEFRSDRFVAAVDRSEDDPTQFQFAYIVRAISPGTFLHPAALVEDMYRPERRARTESGTVEVVGPLH